MSIDIIEPLENYTLQEFTEDAIELKMPRVGETDQTSLLHYTSFVLTGLHPHKKTRAVVDPLQNRISPEEQHNLHEERDFDSVNGLSDDLPFRFKAISVYPVSRFEDTLKKCCHLNFPVVVPGSVSTEWSLG